MPLYHLKYTFSGLAALFKNTFELLKSFDHYGGRPEPSLAFNAAFSECWRDPLSKLLSRSRQLNVFLFCRLPRPRARNCHSCECCTLQAPNTHSNSWPVCIQRTSWKFRGSERRTVFFRQSNRKYSSRKEGGRWRS